jgi:hypothetical protein
MEAGFSKYTNFCSSEKFKKKISLSNSILLNKDSLRFWFTLYFKIKWANNINVPRIPSLVTPVLYKNTRK